MPSQGARRGAGAPPYGCVRRYPSHCFQASRPAQLVLETSRISISGFTLRSVSPARHQTAHTAAGRFLSAASGRRDRMSPRGSCRFVLRITLHITTVREFSGLCHQGEQTGGLRCLFPQLVHVRTEGLIDMRTGAFLSASTRAVPGERLSATPVFILTSMRTFSGAQEFSGNLKALKRAAIVGEVRGGGAHPTRVEASEALDAGIRLAVARIKNSANKNHPPRSP
jgi:peptidase S41-like protein